MWRLSRKKNKMIWRLCVCHIIYMSSKKKKIKMSCFQFQCFWNQPRSLRKILVFRIENIKKHKSNRSSKINIFSIFLLAHLFTRTKAVLATPKFKRGYQLLNKHLPWNLNLTTQTIVGFASILHKWHHACHGLLPHLLLLHETATPKDSRDAYTDTVPTPSSPSFHFISDKRSKSFLFPSSLPLTSDKRSKSSLSGYGSRIHLKTSSISAT